MRATFAVAVLAAAAAAAIAPGADAKTVRLNWVERTPAPTFGYPAMTFRVRTVTASRTSWTVRAEVSNRSPHTIFVRAADLRSYPPLYGFSVLAPRPSCDYGCTPVPFAAARFTPRLPNPLRPGTVWQGTFSGRGRLTGKRGLALSFGRFQVAGGISFSWSTRRTFRL